MPIFKVWCSQREKKKCIVAEGLADLLNNVKVKFSYETIHLVLEEDGTEIEEEDVLNAFAGKTLMVLNDGEVWGSPSCPSTPRSGTPSPNSPSTPQTPVRSIHSNPLWHASTPKKNSDWSLNYEVPWIKLSEPILSKLERSVGREKDPSMKLVKTQLSELVRVITSAIWHKCAYAGRDVFENIAKIMITKYKVLADMDEEGELIGSGTATLVIKMEEHKHYLNRPNKNSSLIALAISPAASGKRKRNHAKGKAQSGTSNWQPEFPNDEDEVSQNEKKKWLLSESKKSARERDTDKVNELMERTYSYQRLFINTKEPTIKQLKEEWPLLLEMEYLLGHSQKLILNFQRETAYMSPEKLKKVIALVEETIIVEKAKAIIEKNEDLKREKMKTAEEAMAIVNNANKVNPIIGAIILIMHKFQERKKGQKLVFVHKEEGSPPEDILAAPHSSSPCIVVVGRTLYEATYYHVVAEGVIICSTSLAEQAITVLYCLFYIFNMEFPQKVGHTWEFLQRYFFRNNPAEGSKNPKKKVQFRNTTARVNSFIRDVVRYRLSGENLEEEEVIDDQ